MGKLINSSVYSIIRDEYSGKNISDAFVLLTKYVIKFREYRPFRIHELCNDFEQYCGFAIPYHPMTVIVNQLKKKGYLYDVYPNTFNPDKDKIECEVSIDVLEKEQNSLNQLIQMFISYARDFECTLSQEEASSAINDFIELNGIDLLRGIQDYSAITDNPTLRLFYSFYTSISKTDHQTVEFIGSLIVGRILADMFISGQDEAIGETKSNASVYLDTSIVFSLLGIEEIDHSQVYIDLLRETQRMGMKVKIFRHTYSELITLIQGSEEWIGNPHYDPFSATAATRFFVTHSYSKRDIAEFASSLSVKLIKFQIEIDEMPYPTSCPIGVKREKDYYDLIVDKYKSTQSSFDEEAKSRTIDKDARSLFYIDYLNSGIRAPLVQSISHIFITRNNALASISRTLVQQNTSEIPDCVNDVFWGTLIWLNNPQRLIASTKIRVAANAYATFLPSTRLKRKLIDSIDSLVQEEEISQEEAYFLKTSSLVQDILLEMTKGDANCFTEQTTIDILNKIKADAKNEGLLEEREMASHTISNLQRDIQTLQSNIEEKEAAHSEEVSELRETIRSAAERERKRDIEELSKKCSDISLSIDHQEQCRHFAEEKLAKHKIVITIVMCLICSCAVFFTITLYRYGNACGKDYLSVISIIFSILMFCCAIAYFILSGKPLSAENFLSRFLQKILEKEYEKCGYSKAEKDRLIQELAAANSELAQLTDSQEECYSM